MWKLKYIKGEDPGGASLTTPSLFFLAQFTIPQLIYTVLWLVAISQFSDLRSIAIDI